MTRTKLLLSAIGSGLVLVVGVPTAVSAVAGPSTQASNPARGESGPARPIDRTCAYPATRTSNLALSGSVNSTVRGGNLTLLGQQAANGCPVKQSTVELYSSTSANGVFTSTGLTAVSDNSGNFSFAVKPTVTTFYRVAYAGDTNLDPVLSNVVRITVNTK